MTVDAAARAVKQRDVQTLAHAFFGYRVTKSQADIIRNITWREHPRTTIRAQTRFGKSFSVALGVCLRILLTNLPLKVAIVAPRRDQARVVRDQIAACIVDCEPLRALVDESTGSLERLRQEASKQRITFEGGKKEVLVLTGHGDGEALLGHGCDLLIRDEAALFSDAAYTNSARMLGDNPDTSQIVELGNPWISDGRFWEHHNSDEWHSIKIDWRTALAEGRTTREFLDEQRRELSESEWTVLYEAEFPTDSEEQLIPWEWVRRAIDNHPDPLPSDGVVRHGLDVAEDGADHTVLTTVRSVDGVFHVTSIQRWDYADTMHTANRVDDVVDKGEEIVVDVIGVGKGVGDRLKELGHAVRPLKVSRAAKDKNRFTNLKAEVFFTLRELFEAERITLPDHATLRRELLLYRKDLKSGRNRVYEAGNKSPDYGDSLAYAVWGPVGVTAPVYW